MGNNIHIHFKYGTRMYSLLLKTSVEEITLSMVEAMICKKFGLDETTEKVSLSYIPLVVGCEEKCNIDEDDDLRVYLSTIDKENRRCLLHLEVMKSSELPEQLSRACRESSFGVNYDNDMRYEIGGNVVAVDVENGEAVREDEGMNEDDDSIEGNSMDSSYMRDECAEVPPISEDNQYTEAWEDGLGVNVGQEFPNRKAVQELVDRVAFENSFGFELKKSDNGRLVLHCRQQSCKWRLRAAKIKNSQTFSIRTYNKMHTCSRASQSTSNQKRKGTRRLVASMLHDDYPGQMDTPPPRTIQNLIQNKLGVKISYSTALRGKNLHVYDLRGNPEDSYKKLYSYLYMLEKVNQGTVTSVKLDEIGKFLYLFIALGACIEGFQCMRKVITVDATHLKNGYRGALVFAAAQDPNRHNYPIAFGVIDSENNDSWTWFFQLLKTVVPDSSELVFMSDRNPSLITAIANVYPSAHHGYCVWHLSQNVKSHVYNVNKDVVAWRFIECSRIYTVPKFEHIYSEFEARYPSAAKYLVETTGNLKQTWARCYFPGERYNIDTSNTVLLDTIISKISEWFNDHRNEAAAVPVEHKLVPFV